MSNDNSVFWLFLQKYKIHGQPHRWTIKNKGWDTDSNAPIQNKNKRDIDPFGSQKLAGEEKWYMFNVKSKQVRDNVTFPLN